MNLKLMNRDDKNTELLITTGFVLIVIGFIQFIGATILDSIISGIVILGIGAYRFLKKRRGNKK